MQDILDLNRYPLDRPDSDAWWELVETCRRDLAENGMFNLVGLMLPEVAQESAMSLSPRFANQAFNHSREHNIYFLDSIPGLRTDQDPNYQGVADLLTENDHQVRRLSLSPGTLNVFWGKNTPHKILPVSGPRERIVAVFSFYEKPGVQFTNEERVGFYGRAS